MHEASELIHAHGPIESRIEILCKKESWLPPTIVAIELSELTLGGADGVTETDDGYLQS